MSPSLKPGALQRFLVTFQPTGRDIYVSPGIVVKDAIYLARFDFDFPCGGRGKCGKCRVRINSGAAAPTGIEQEHLEAEELAQGFRLACVTEIRQDITVDLPFTKTPEHQILVAGLDRDVKLDPHLHKTLVELDLPSLQDQRPDWERLKEALTREGLLAKEAPAPLALLRNLPQLLRQANFRLTAVTDGRALTGLAKADTSTDMLGIAFDIGTTTVVGYLMDLGSGKELGVVSALNPQTRYGADVITRNAFAAQKEHGLEILRDAIVEQLNLLIGEAVEKVGAAREQVYAVSVVGNTTMHHLFLGISPKHLALAPYVPVIAEPLSAPAQETGIAINAAGRVYVLPNIAGFVGADTVGVILATDLDWSESIKLAIDIGTNGEIVLGSRDRLVACSAAAGPAFEGSQISCGMRGTIGAIDHVQFGDGIGYSVVGAGRPEGICGSGLLDAVASLLEQGVIDHRGRLLPPDMSGVQAARYKDRIIVHEGANALLLANESETAHGRPILITQKDIREVQLAKGAIAAGIQVLLEQLGASLDDISEVLLAGAFGNYLDPHSACAIGLIPQTLEGKIRPVGNAAGSGAKMALLSRSEYRRAGLIASMVDYVELSAYKNFIDIFAGAMYFPSPQQ
jgi:uncharacterized 2Fe-2S/4Fe-4S cluster protein (DUF4445 family)